MYAITIAEAAVILIFALLYGAMIVLLWPVGVYCWLRTLRSG